MKNEEAIETLKQLILQGTDERLKNDYEAIDFAIKALEERPQGEWIVDEEHEFLNSKKCSNCGEVAEWLDGGSQLLSNFCPNCGADMRTQKK